MGFVETWEGIGNSNKVIEMGDYLARITGYSEFNKEGDPLVLERKTQDGREYTVPGIRFEFKILKCLDDESLTEEYKDFDTHKTMVRSDHEKANYPKFLTAAYRRRIKAGVEHLAFDELVGQLIILKIDNKFNSNGEKYSFIAAFEPYRVAPKVEEEPF